MVLTEEYGRFRQFEAATDQSGCGDSRPHREIEPRLLYSNRKVAFLRARTSTRFHDDFRTPWPIFQSPISDPRVGFCHAEPEVSFRIESSNDIEQSEMRNQFDFETIDSAG